ncbi:MAG: TIGR03905 family TSCPD domain-containing protein [Firmicutes bacterium]|nr:TIGR03905 family TSCPD domain-containing protein [Bacillota bacterium]MBR3707099.1 TIGR03905 family TSCPD domain-containing protein [Bacillota bacterium]MBR6584314.1 TIGR03905 family TSCPD domain-containing protein [Bacillota bacterium]
MKYEYRTSGTCSRSIYIDVEDGIVKDVEFYGGCNGNLKGIAALVKGMKVEDVIEKVKGIKCGVKGTSCPDQLACALEDIMAE